MAATLSQAISAGFLNPIACLEYLPGVEYGIVLVFLALAPTIFVDQVVVEADLGNHGPVVAAILGSTSFWRARMLLSVFDS